MKRLTILNLWIPILIGISLLVYVILRAALLPITHDEANTCLTFSVTSVWDIITYTDPIPNNHILNTLLIKLFTWIFGMHAFIARLPNILGFVLYFSIILIWLRQLSSSFIFIIAGIVIFTCNPYLMDFFSLARGYALSISFMITACFFTWKYFQTKRSGTRLYALIFAALAVYTNFTTLNFYLALFLLIFIADAHSYFKSDRGKFYRSLTQLLLVSSVLALFSFYPIYRMVSTGQFVYWGTKGFYPDTLLTLVSASSYGKQYLNLPANSYADIYIYFIFIMMIFAVIELKNHKFRISSDPFAFFVLLLLFAIAINILQYYTVHTPYLTSRTALFYYPLSMVAILFFLRFLKENFLAGFRMFSGLFILTGMVHVLGSMNLSYVYEWWYDKNTFDVISKMEELNPRGELITLDADWLFYPSLNFHLITDAHKQIRLLDYHKDIDSNSTARYYFINAGDFPLLKNKYDTVCTFEYGTRILLEKKVN